MLAVLMMNFTRKYVGDIAGISGLNEGMLVGLDWDTWVSRRAQMQQRMVYWSGFGAREYSCTFIKKIVR